jgi:hypothetical protein
LLLLSESTADSAVEYVVGGLELGGAEREAAAQLLADTAMQIVCGESPVLERWRNRRDGGPPETGTALKAVETFVSIGFGTPGSPPNDDHLQGHVAELIWYLVIAERLVARDGRALVRAHPVKADPLEPGGDGLVVYVTPSGDYVFRLWEIKKHTAQAVISGTINRAGKQLAKRGHEYLAKLSGPESMVEDSSLRELYSSMVDLWFDRSEKAGVGVSVGTSASTAPSSHRSFGSIRTAFPSFALPAQTEAIVVAIPDFADFASRVKGIVWSGL